MHRDLLSAGLRTLPLKGAALVDLVYAGAGDRPMDDVDLLCLDDARAAGERLRAQGYRPGPVADHAVALEAPGGGWVELHHALASCPSLHPFDADAWWERRRTSPRVTPSVTDLLLQAGVHAAFQHGLALKLVQYVDLRRLSARPDLVPGELAGNEAVALALHQAEALIGGMPPRVLETLPLPAHLRALVSAGLPSPRRVARVRWALARGRRLRFLRDTLLPKHVTAREAAARLARLVRRLR